MYHGRRQTPGTGHRGSAGLTPSVDMSTTPAINDHMTDSMRRTDPACRSAPALRGSTNEQH